MNTRTTAPLLRKLGLQQAALPAQAAVLGAPAEALASLSAQGLPAPLLKRRRLAGQLDFLLYFATRLATLDARLPALRQHLAERGKLWICWPKAGGRGTDLSLNTINACAYGHGLVESKAISVDETWSAMRFTHPIPGRRYRNHAVRGGAPTLASSPP